MASQRWGGGLMTVQLPSAGPHVPTTAAEWDRVRELKLEILAKDPLLVRPEDYPQLRADVVMSWKRSMRARVDPWSTVFPADEDFAPKSRLAQVAQPIMNRLE